jgi:hypothetical protein
MDLDAHAQQHADFALRSSNALVSLVFVANGSAIIYLMTFFGSLWDIDIRHFYVLAASMRIPLVLFLSGVLLSALAYIISYYTNLRIHKKYMYRMYSDMGLDSGVRFEQEAWEKLLSTWIYPFVVVGGVFVFAAGAWEVLGGLTAIPALYA